MSLFDRFAILELQLGLGSVEFYTIVKCKNGL